MWISERDMRREQGEPAAELGVVTLGGDPAGVSLGGERRQLPGVQPRRGDLASGGGRQSPGAEDGGGGGAALRHWTGAAGAGTLAPGEVRLAAPGGGGGVLAGRDGVNLYGTVKVGWHGDTDYVPGRGISVLSE